MQVRKPQLELDNRLVPNRKRSTSMKHKLESRLLGEISITSDMQMIPTLTAESEEELKSLLMRVKEDSEKLA